MTDDAEIKDWVTSMLSVASMASFAIPVVGPVVGSLGMLGAALANMLWKTHPESIEAMTKALDQAEQDLSLQTNLDMALIRNGLELIDRERSELTAAGVTDEAVTNIIKQFTTAYEDYVGEDDTGKLTTQLNNLKGVVLSNEASNWKETYQGLGLYTLGATVFLQMHTHLLWAEVDWDDKKTSDSAWFAGLKFFVGQPGGSPGPFVQTVSDAHDVVYAGLFQDVERVNRAWGLDPAWKAVMTSLAAATPAQADAIFKSQEFRGSPDKGAPLILWQAVTSYDPAPVTTSLVSAEAAMQSWQDTLAKWQAAADAESSAQPAALQPRP